MRYFYLCLVYEYLLVEEVVHALQVIIEMVTYLIKMIGGEQRREER